MHKSLLFGPLYQIECLLSFVGYFWELAYDIQMIMVNEAPNLAMKMPRSLTETNIEFAMMFQEIINNAIGQAD